MENKKSRSKEIVKSLFIDKLAMGANDELIRESLKEEGLDPEKVYKEYAEKVEQLVKQAQENKKKKAILKRSRPKL